MPHPHQPYIDEYATEAERTYATFNHLVGLLSMLDATFLGLIGAVVMWRIKKDESPFLDDHGKEAVNFNLSMLIYMLAGTAIIAVVSLGILVLPWIVFLYILRLVATIKGAIAAHRSEYYRYPMCFRFFA